MKVRSMTRKMFQWLAAAVILPCLCIATAMTAAAQEKVGGTVEFALDEFTAMGTMKFSLSAEDVAVAEAADGYSLSGEIDTVSGETKVTGSVSGTVGSDGTAEITFVFTPGAMPMSITGVFTSPAPDEGSGDSAVEGGNE